MSALLITLFGFGEKAQAEPRPGTLGAGVIFGEPTGLVGKYWLDRRDAIDAGLAFSFNDFLLVYGDYQYHFVGAFSEGRKKSDFLSTLTPYLGAGAALFISTESNRSDNKLFTEDGSVGVGIRIPIGLEWTPKEPPIGVFAEIVPGVGIIPSTYGFLQGGIGIRYYFG